MKSWYRSSAIWTNIAVFVAAVVPLLLAYLSGLPISEDTAGVIAATLGVFNAVLQIGIRVFLTNTGIHTPAGGSSG